MLLVKLKLILYTVFARKRLVDSSVNGKQSASFDYLISPIEKPMTIQGYWLAAGLLKFFVILVYVAN